MAPGRETGRGARAVDGWRPAGEAEAVRFIGILEAPESAGRVAVLADGAGVHHGRVGDVVVGRYRIVALDRSALLLERLEDWGTADLEAERRVKAGAVGSPWKCALARGTCACGSLWRRS